MQNSPTSIPESIKIVFIGDVVSQPGRQAIGDFLPKIEKDEGFDLVIANAENAAGGTGLTPQVIEDLLDLGVDVLTSGNHIWRKKEVIGELDTRPNILRPANYPEGTPGRGHCLIQHGGVKVGVLNLCGRVFMSPIECPFRTAERIVEELRRETPVIFVDMHAEATSEKQAMGYFLDGKVSAVVGTHTHVQTSDARILPEGTAYITDAGMSGPSESVLGVKKQIIINRFMTQRPQKFEIARQYPQIEGVITEINTVTGKAESIRAFRHTARS